MQQFASLLVDVQLRAKRNGLKLAVLVALTRTKLENLDETCQNHKVKPSLKMVDEPCQNSLGIFNIAFNASNLTKYRN